MADEINWQQRAEAAEKEIALLKQVLQDAGTAHSTEVADLEKQHAERVRAALAQQEQALRAEFAATLKAERESVLIPAMKDLQARQAADLRAKHDAELAKLTGG